MHSKNGKLNMQNIGKRKKWFVSVLYSVDCDDVCSEKEKKKHKEVEIYLMSSTFQTLGIAIYSKKAEKWSYIKKSIFDSHWILKNKKNLNKIEEDNLGF